MRFSSIPELEYEVAMRHTFCSDASITDQGLDSKIEVEADFRERFLAYVAESTGNEGDLAEAVDEVLTERRALFSLLRNFEAQFYPYDDYAEESEGVPASEPIESQEEVSLSEEAEDEEPEEISEEGEIHAEETFAEPPKRESIIRVIAKNIGTFKEPIMLYLKAYSRLCNLVLKCSVKSRNPFLALVSQLANLDILSVGRSGIDSQILVPLDLCPHRLALALDSQAVLDVNRYDSFYIPPVVARMLNGKEHVFHAYRSVDGYPVLFPAINMEEKAIGKEREQQFRQEIGGATKILYSLKRGKRAVRFPLKDLSEILEVFLQQFPQARDRLALVDLGVGTGGLLKNVIGSFIKDHAAHMLDSRSTWLVILNDLYEEERTGEDFVHYASSDIASQLIKDVRKIIGDMGKAAELLKDSNMDICFINRVLDMYAKYGFYSVDLEKSKDVLPSASIVQLEDTEHRGKLLVYSNLILFKDVYNLERQLIRNEELNERMILPGVSYNLKGDFFEPRGLKLNDLVEMARLVVISVFPATEQTLFPDSAAEGIHLCSIGETDLRKKPRYVIFCLSKDKELIKAIAEHYSTDQP